MSSWLQIARDALTLRTEAFADLAARRDAFLRGCVVIVLVALFVGLPVVIGDVIRGLRGGSVVAEMDNAAAEFERGLQQMTPFLQNVPPEVQAMILEQARAGFKLGAEIATRVEKVPTILPRPLNAVLEAFGRWLSRPFGGASFPLAAAVLGTWLGYGIWVMLAAKLLGGQGTLTGFFGATSLYALPHVLNIFQPIPFLGGLMGFIAFIWGALIYIKATAVSHQITVERALLAVLLPLLVVILLVVVIVSGLAGILAIALSGR